MDIMHCKERLFLRATVLEVPNEVVDHFIDGVTGKRHRHVIDERVQCLVVRMLDSHPGGAQARRVHESFVAQHILLASEHVRVRQTGHATREKRREVLVSDDSLEGVPHGRVAPENNAGRIVCCLHITWQH